jgi:hypothetical protein
MDPALFESIIQKAVRFRMKRIEHDTADLFVEAMDGHDWRS